jgi:hypothetical protein
MKSSQYEVAKNIDHWCNNSEAQDIWIAQQRQASEARKYAKCCNPKDEESESISTTDLFKDWHHNEIRDSREVARFAGIIQKQYLDNGSVLTAQNRDNESAWGSVFSQFYWESPRDASFGSKTGISLLYSMHIDQDISDQDTDQIPSTNESLRRYPIECSELELQHDGKGKNNMEQDDDDLEYVSHGSNGCLPADTSSRDQ